MFELIKKGNMIQSGDLLFDNMLNNIFGNIHNTSSDYYYSSDDKCHYIELAFPGLNKKDINLTINDNYLSLSHDSSQDDKNSIWNKSFNRRIKLPNNIKKDGVSAKLKDGILSIKIEKVNPIKNTKVIEIK